MESGFETEQLVEKLVRMNKARCETEEGRRINHYLEQVSQSVTDYNQQMSQLGQKAAPGFCSAGCCHCCNQTFLLYQPEVDIIVKYLLEREELLREFINNYHAREQKLLAHQELLAQCQESGEAAMEFYRLKIPCALLKDNLCMVYPVRPIVCSAFVSLIPPRICAMEPKSIVTGPMKSLFNQIDGWLKSVCQQGGYPTGKVGDVSLQVMNTLNRLAAE